MLAAAALAGLSSPATAQTTLTMSSWVSPSHPLTKDVLAVWAQQVEKATNGRVKLQMLPKHPSAASRHVRRGQGWPRRRLLRHGQLHAGPPRAAAAARAARRRRHGRDQLGRLLAHPLEVSAPGRRVQGRQAARRLHARAGPDVQHQAADHQGRGPRRHEDPLRRRHLRGDGARARRLGLRQAGAGILRAAELRRRRRHVLPARVDQLLQARHGRSSTPRCFPAASTAPRSASS